LFLVSVAKDALRGATAELRDEGVEAGAVPRGLLALAHFAHAVNVSPPRQTASADSGDVEHHAVADLVLADAGERDVDVVEPHALDDGGDPVASAEAKHLSDRGAVADLARRDRLLAVEQRGGRDLHDARGRTNEAQRAVRAKRPQVVDPIEARAHGA